MMNANPRKAFPAEKMRYALRYDADELKTTAEDAADLLSAMSNAKRLLILLNLVDGERPVGQLAEMVGLSQSALSQHLAKLRARKLVSTRRDAQTIYYSIASDSVHHVLQTIGDIFLDSEDDKGRRTATGTA